MKQIRTILAAIAIISALSIIITSDPVSGSGSQAATFDRIELDVTPNVQGLGGELEVQVTCYFYGGCCYPLFANDIVPELEVPDGLTLLSGPSPERKGELTAAAGGDPTIVIFKWNLHCTEKGSYQINATVLTSDCGSRDETQLVHVIKGATISNPETFPVDPTSDKDIMINFVSMYPVGDIDVTSARIYYIYTDDKYDPADLSADNSTMMKGGVGIGEGLEVSCVPEEIVEGGFKGTIPEGSHENLYYWIQVTDERGELTTSSVRHTQVENTDRVDTLNMASFLFLIVGMVVLIAGLVLGYIVTQKRKNTPDKDDNFTVLGSIGRKRFLTVGEAGHMDVKKESNLAYIIVIVVIVIALAAAVVGIVTGQAAELFDHFLEGI